MFILIVSTRTVCSCRNKRIHLSPGDTVVGTVQCLTISQSLGACFRRSRLGSFQRIACGTNFRPPTGCVTEVIGADARCLFTNLIWVEQSCSSYSLLLYPGHPRLISENVKSMITDGITPFALRPVAQSPGARFQSGGSVTAGQARQGGHHKSAKNL